MKSRKRIFSLILALTIALGALGLPSFTKGFVNAAALGSVQSAKSLEINYNKFSEIEHDVITNNGFVASEYVSSDLNAGDVYVTVWAPDSTVIVKDKKVETGVETCTFTEPGLYGVMYRLADSNSVIYSKQYYVAVSSSVEEIELSETVSNTAKTGTFVEIPECKTSNVSIKVFSPYGENVPINDGKFTNLSNVKGTYYIEYSKDIKVGPNPEDEEKQCVYVTVEFGDNYKESVTKKIEEEKPEEKANKFVFNDSLKEIEKDGTIYLFKTYNLLDLQIEDVDGNVYDDITLTDTKIQIKATNSLGQLAYYDFENDEFVSNLVSPTEMSSGFVQVFTPTDMEGLDSITDTGVRYEIVYSSETYDIEQTIKCTTKFDLTAYNFECDGIFKDAILVDKETEANNKYTLPECVLTIAPGYDNAKYQSFLSSEGIQIEVYFTDDAGNRVDFVEADGDYIISGREIDFSHITEVAKTKDFSYSMVVKYSYDYKIEAEQDIEGSLERSYNTCLSTKAIDKKAPTDLKVDSYEYVVYTTGGEASVTLPTASANDLKDDGKSSNGVNITVSYNDMLGVEKTAKPGDSVLLEAGNYCFTYIYEDTSGNSRTKEIYLKVCESDYDDFSGAINVNASVEYEEENNKYIFQFSSANVTNALVYENGKAVKSPAVAEINNGLTKIELYAEEDFVVVLNGRSSLVDVYTSISIQDLNEVTDVKPFAYGKAEKSTTYVAEGYDVLSVRVGDSILWLQSDDFSVETTNGIYEIEGGNRIIVKYPGKYVLTNKTTGVKTNVTALENSISDVKFFINMKQIVSNRTANVENKTVTIQHPYIPNYFGYVISTIVTTSDGIQVAVEDDEFVVEKTDDYTVTFKLVCASTTKEEIVVVSSGKIVNPTIIISKTYGNVIWTGEPNKVYLVGATATDKFGEAISIVETRVYDAFGKSIEIKSDGNGAYIEVTDAGIYTVYYTATDSDGFTTTSQVEFMVLYEEKEDDKKLSAWAIVGIVAGSLVAAGLIALAVYTVIKSNKNKNKFVNKTKQAKKEKKASEERETSQILFTIAQNKSETEWTIKRGTRVIGKASTKEEALAKIEEEGLEKKKIKVYNKQGRLIDSID